MSGIKFHPSLQRRYREDLSGAGIRGEKSQNYISSRSRESQTGLKLGMGRGPGQENESLAAFSFSSQEGKSCSLSEELSSFCRDTILIKERGDRRLLMNPDYEEEIRKEETQLSLEALMDCLTKIDYAIYGLGKNLNVNLLVSSFFSYFKEWEYV
jgi:hypothetical protein